MNKKYYAERNGLFDPDYRFSLDTLLSLFYDIYKYFENKQYFYYAFYGASTQNESLPPSMGPSPALFFIKHLKTRKSWPIEKQWPWYNESTLFTVIEMLYDHIGMYDYEAGKLVAQDAKKEFAEAINDILKIYGDGYYLEPNHGFIIKIPNEALQHQLMDEGEGMPDDIYDKLSEASQMFYRYDSTEKMKEGAILLLAKILENVRDELKELLNTEYEINKNEHDKLIFEIINRFDVRHGNGKQHAAYSKDIWYDWMMQYYTSVIIAYYKLKLKKEEAGQ